MTHLKLLGKGLLLYPIRNILGWTLECRPHRGANTDRILNPPRRGNNVIKVKGMLINPQSTDAVMSDEIGIAEYQVVI